MHVIIIIIIIYVLCCASNYFTTAQLSDKHLANYNVSDDVKITSGRVCRFYPVSTGTPTYFMGMSAYHCCHGRQTSKLGCRLHWL